MFVCVSVCVACVSVRVIVSVGVRTDIDDLMLGAAQPCHPVCVRMCVSVFVGMCVCV